MKKNKAFAIVNKSSLVVFLVFLLAFAALTSAVVYAGISYKVESGSPAESEALNFGDGWTNAATGETISLPVSFNGEDFSSITLVKKLPAGFDDADTVCVKTRYQRIKVSIDGDEVYSFGYKSDTPHGPIIGYAWNMVGLENDYAGKEMRMEITPASSEYLSGVYDVSIGMSGNILMSIIDSNMLMLVFCLFLFVIGLLCFATGLFMSTTGFRVMQSILYIGVFTMLATVWIIADSQMLWVFFGNRAAAYYISFGSFMLLAIPMLMFVREVTHGHSAILNTLCVIFSAVFIAQFVLHFTDIIHLQHSLVATHVLILVSIVIVVVVTILDFVRRHNKTLREILIGFMILAVMSMVALANYYMQTVVDYSLFFRFGLLAFIVMLIIGAVRNGINAINERIASQTYRSIAFTDVLTGLANRTAFSTYMDDLREKLNELDTVAVIMLDLNNLKNTNDTLGHSAGDRLITDTAQISVKAFGGCGKCFRIGGDEFTVVFENISEEELCSRIDCFNCLIKEHNESISPQISIAVGHDIRAAKHAEPYDILNTADARMYEHKLKMKRAALISAKKKDYI